MSRRPAVLVVLTLALGPMALGCGQGRPVDESTSGAGGAGGVGSATSSGGGGAPVQTLDGLVAALRADRDGTLLAVSRDGGWPAVLPGGYLVVSSEPDLDHLAGEATGWQPVAMTREATFAWHVVEGAPASGYKLTDGASAWRADPWARSYGYDEHGEMSYLSAPTSAHHERHHEVASHGLTPRTVRLWIPPKSPTRVLYVHDGQNLFDPEAIGGGWHLAESAPDDVLLVGIDNTPERMAEYTHVADNLGEGPLGGNGDAYADFLHETVRDLVATRYGEPPIVGVMGSSLGGLISLHVVNRHPGDYRFVASLSGTLGWGSIGKASHAETMIERFPADAPGAAVVYLDSGGGGPCADLDGDGVEDDGEGTDNYCETKQLEGALLAAGYTSGVNVHHWHEPGAAHHESAWAARVWRPLEIFGALP